MATCSGKFFFELVVVAGPTNSESRMTMMMVVVVLVVDLKLRYPFYIALRQFVSSSRHLAEGAVHNAHTISNLKYLFPPLLLAIALLLAYHCTVLHDERLVLQNRL